MLAQARDDRPPPRVDVMPIRYGDHAPEPALMGWAYSSAAIAQRWDAGRSGMRVVADAPR